MKTIAVVAHYDVNGIADDYLIPLFEKLSEVCDKIVIVTTSGIDEPSKSKISAFGDIQIIKRDNVGYDFLSYKVGINSITDLYLYDRLLVLNDSFYISERFDLKNIILQSENKDIFGITSTNQFRFHVQSYFLIFNKKAILSYWFFHFWNGVFSYKRKMKIIFEYEMGLTSSALKHGLTVGSALSFNHNENPCHKNVEQLFQAFGMVKIDVLRNNISYFDISKFSHSNIIKNHLTRTTSSYSNRNLSYGQNVQAGDNFFEFTHISGNWTDVAVILHVFYPDISAEMSEFLTKIPFNIDVFITTPEESYIPGLLDVFKGISNSLYIAVTENKGRDVYPFVRMMQSHDFRKYSMVLKLHTKKSKYSALGDVWRRNIYSGLVPSSSKMSDLHSKFINSKLGIAAQFKDYLSNSNYWGANEERFHLYANRLGLSKEKTSLLFVGGTMFWFHPDALYPIVNLINEDDFEEELNQQDGTFAHVFERLTCMSSISKGYKIVDIADYNEIESSMVVNNEVIVLK